MSVLVEIVSVGSQSKLDDLIGKRGELIEKKTDQQVHAYRVDFGNEKLWFTKENLKRIDAECEAA